MNLERPVSLSETDLLGQLDPCGGGDPIPLMRKKILIGRRSSCQVTLPFPNVSSHHCELELVNGYWRVKDLGSTNGIKVNGEKCDMKWLMPGDELRVAKHAFKIDYQPLGTAPPETDEIDILAEGLLEKAGLEGHPRRRSSSADIIPPGRKRKRSEPKPPEPKPTPRDSDEDNAYDMLIGDS